MCKVTAEQCVQYVSVYILYTYLKNICPFWLRFHFDCTSAGYTAAGQWQAKTHHQYQALTRAIIYAIEEMHGGEAVEWVHVRGHSGDPLNEAADAASWAAACGWTRSSTIQHWMQLLGGGNGDVQEAVHWLWLLLASKSRPLAGPRLDERNKCWWLTVPRCDAGLHGRQHSLPKFQEAIGGPTNDKFGGPFRVKMATANVLTLHPHRHGQHGVGPSARMDSLLRQAAEANYMFVGIQESRCKGQGHRFTDEYHVLSGPATCRGTGGVQLWVRRQTVTPEGKLTVGVGDLRILKATSRQLIVRLSTSWANWIIVMPLTTKPRQTQKNGGDCYPYQLGTNHGRYLDYWMPTLMSVKRSQSMLETMERRIRKTPMDEHYVSGFSNTRRFYHKPLKQHIQDHIGHGSMALAPKAGLTMLPFQASWQTWR